MLDTNKKVMTWLCMVPPDESSSINQRIAYYLVGMFVFAWNVIGVAGDAAYFFVHIKSDMSEALFALMGTIAGGSMIYVAITAFTFRRKILIIYDRLSDIYDSGECICPQKLSVCKISIFELFI